MLSNVKLTAANVPHKESLTTEEKATLWKNISSALIETGRPGIKRLLNWMQSDCRNGVMNYVNAPASTKYHGNYPGGLMEHSWNVYVWLTIIVGNANSMKDADAQLKNEESKAMMDSAAIVALLHDICKVGFYSMEPKNRKTYDAEKVKNALQKDVKHDSLGDFICETVMSYTVTDTHKFGHGEASVAIIEKFLGVLGLTTEERMAIRYHMGDFANGFYSMEPKNRKTYDAEKVKNALQKDVKHDSLGDFICETVMSYTVTDTHKFGHGEASVAIIEKFLGVLGLTTEERMAIRYHMGDFANERETSEVYNRYPLAAMLHMADLAATYLEERECTDQMDVFWDTVKAFARPVKAPEQAQPATADAPKPDAETPSKQEMPRGPFPGQG